MLRMAAFLVGLTGPLVQKVYENVRSISKFPINNSIIKLIEENSKNVCLEHGKALEFYCVDDEVWLPEGNMLDLRFVGHTQATQDTPKKGVERDDNERTQGP